jgi:hypothetical protein
MTIFLSKLKWQRIGAEVKYYFSVSKAFWQVRNYMNRVSFVIRAFQGCTMH